MFAKAIGFPLLVFQAMITPGWMVGLVVSIVLVWGKHFKDDSRMKHVPDRRVVKGDDEEDDDDREKIESLRSLSHVEVAIFLLQSDPMLRSNSAIRMRSYRRGSIAPAEVAVVQSPVEAFKMETTELRSPTNDLPGRTTAVLPLNKPTKSKSSRVFTSRAFEGRRVGNSSNGDKIQTPEITSKPSGSSSVWRPPPFKTRRTMTKLGAEITTKLSNENRQALLALSDASKENYIRHVLPVLHWTEFLLLVDFAEMIIPIVYSAYLSAAYHLPNKVYYAQLRNTDDAKFHASIAKILIYALFEGISLVFLGVVLHRQLKLSAVRQLTFVLET